MRRARGYCLALALVVAAVLPGVAAPARAADAADTWTAASPMGAGRVWHTATLLPDGQVLVVGGMAPGGGPPLATAERYDPATDAWRGAAPLTTPRSGQAAAALPDGRVFVVGGAQVSTAEIYDPEADRWAATAPGAPSGSGTATTLRDGRVLVVSGGSAAVYDPAADRWTPTGPLDPHGGGGGHTATRLTNGQVLVTGGILGSCGRSLCVNNTADLYDPATNAWVTVAPMRVARAQHTAALLSDGSVLVVGDFGFSQTPERFDPATGTWSPAGTPPVFFVAGGQTLTALPGGRALWVGAAADISTALLYDAASNAWTRVAAPGIPRAHHTATLLPDGRVLVVGGDRGGATAEIYGPAPAPAGACFAATGECVGGRFLAYWQAHGGLALNGYPLTDERWEILEDGKPYVVQYFERVRMEYHPENPPPYDVLLGQFGRLLYLTDPANPQGTAAAPAPGATYFPETGHNLSGGFRDYWNAHGGLAQFGYPLSEEIQERLEDGQTYTVQYFERARFEWHPANPAPWDVELGQFGRRVLTALDPAAPLPYPLAGNMRQIYPGDTGVRFRLGPPTAEAAQVPGAFLPFQHGAMVWRGDTKTIYVIVLDPGRTNGGAPIGSWSSYPDTWDPSQGDVGGTAPGPGLYIPQRGFGKVWREHPDLQRQLGYALSPTEQAVALYAQPFLGGLVLDGARDPSGQVDFFYTNGRAQWMMSLGFR